MTACCSRPPRRSGLSLLEVLIALAIFLISLIGLGQLITISGERSLDVQQQGYAAQLCQSKLAEVLSGVVPVSGSQSEVPFDDDPDWHWSLDAQQNSISGLWQIQVRVTRQRGDGKKIECVLNQLMLDPSLRGSTLDNPAANNSNSTDPNAPAAASGNSSTPAGGGAVGGAAAPARPAASPAPAASGARPAAGRGGS